MNEIFIYLFIYVPNFKLFCTGVQPINNVVIVSEEQ